MPRVESLTTAKIMELLADQEATNSGNYDALEAAHAALQAQVTAISSANGVNASAIASQLSTLNALIASLAATPSVVTGAFTPATGWGFTGTMYEWFKMRFVNFTIVNNTGGTIANSATFGLYSPVPTVGTIALGHRPRQTLGIPASSNSSVARILTASGTVSLQIGVHGIALAEGASHNFGSAYLVA